MVTTITGAVVLLLLVSQSAMAFVKGDRVQLSLNKRLGPFTVASCRVLDQEQICLLKETGYSVNYKYLQKVDANYKAPKDLKEVAVEGSSVPMYFSK